MSRRGERSPQGRRYRSGAKAGFRHYTRNEAAGFLHFGDRRGGADAGEVGRAPVSPWETVEIHDERELRLWICRISEDWR